MKIIVNVYVPAISKEFDILIPNNLKIAFVTNLIAEAVEKNSNHLYLASGNETLCSKDKNIILRSNTTLEKYGIKNGDHLIMM